MLRKAHSISAAKDFWNDATGRAAIGNAAVTALHRDTNVWEIETFEGDQGYSPEMWNQLLEIREFSRELWEIALGKSYVPPKEQGQSRSGHA